MSDPFLQGCAERIRVVDTWLNRGRSLDNVGLGTYQAALLLRTAPDVDLFIAEVLDTTSTKTGKEAFLDRVVAVGAQSGFSRGKRRVKIADVTLGNE